MRFIPPVVLLLLVALAGCSDVISPAGDGILPPQDGIVVDSVVLTAAASETYQQRIIGVLTTLLLGKSENMESRVVMRFNGIPTDKQTAVIDSASLRLRVNYRFRDSIGTLALEVRRILKSWTESTMNWDSTNVAGTLNSTIDTVALFSITPQDSVISIRIDPVVRAWFAAGSSTPYGFALMPSLGSTIVAGLSTYSDVSVDYRPNLVISYHTDTDTATLSLFPSARSSVSDGTVPSTPGIDYIQGGISYRTKMKFNISSLPPSASITSAQLSYAVDTPASFANSFTRYQMIVHYALSDAASPLLSTYSASGNPKDSTNAAYSAEVRQIVQTWHSGTANNGFVLRASGESQTLDRYALYGATATDTLRRPRLKIIYSILP